MAATLDRRTLALVVLATLAAVALLATGTAAEERHGDWRVMDDETRSGVTIVVTGRLTVDLGATLYLEDCTLVLEGGEVEDLRVSVRSGQLVLDGTDVVSRVPGLITVDDDLLVTGDVEIRYMSVNVNSLGKLRFRDAEALLVGAYVPPSTFDPSRVNVDGTMSLVDSEVSLHHAIIRSRGVFTMKGSELDATMDYGTDHPYSNRRVVLEGGLGSLTGSLLWDVWGGVECRATLSATDTVFASADLSLQAPVGLESLQANIVECTFHNADLVLGIEADRRMSLLLDLRVRDVIFHGGHLFMGLNDTYRGDVLIHGMTMTGYTDFGVEIDASGFDGTMVLEDLDIQGHHGVRVEGDFSGLVVRDGRLSVQGSAVDVTGTFATIPAQLHNLTVTADRGISIRHAVLQVTSSDLTACTVPVQGEAGSATTLVDCRLDVEGPRLEVAPGQRSAKLHVEHHLVIDEVRWTIGDPIDEGEVILETHHQDLITPSWVTWQVGDEEMPLLRLLEWTVYGDGYETRLIFTEVQPKLETQGHMFRSPALIDPWDGRPVDLVFRDEVKPEVHLSDGKNLVVTVPWIELGGTCSDVGTGIDRVEWVLETSEGEEVARGDVDELSAPSWATQVSLTGDMQFITMVAHDRSGNVQTLGLRPVNVEVSKPVLTVIEPEAGLVTSEPYLHVLGIADLYASEVEVYVLGSTVRKTVPVINRRFAAFLQLPNEGLNQLVVTSFDAYGGQDEKQLRVTLDTTPPTIRLEGLKEDRVNHVTTPSLVIAGWTDDTRATILVGNQQAGLTENRTFAVTLRLREGLQVVQLQAEDEAGNINRLYLQVALDTVPPALELVSPASTDFWSREYEMDVVVRPSEPEALITLNDEPVTVSEGVITHHVYLVQGTPTVLRFHAVDAAGNTADLEVAIRLDVESPRMNLVSPLDNALLNTTAVQLIVVVVNDDPRCTLLVNGEPVTAREVASGRLVGTVHLPGPDGTRHLNVTLVDRAGNIDWQELTVRVDTTNPTIFLEGLYDGIRLTTDPVRVRGITSDDARVVWVGDEMAALAPDGGFTAKWVPVEGWQILTVRVIDKAGNEARLSINVKALATPDVEPPVALLAGATILMAMGALLASTEAGRWSLLALLLPLYTKLKKEKILDQRTRGLIQGYITANPGANYTIIRDNLDLADGTLTYHLQVLEREGFVYSVREGLFRCFYPKGIRPPRRGKLHLSDTQMDIVRVVKRIPGITVGEIATAMNRRPNVISYHIKLLRDGGLITVEEDGRHIRVYPVDAAVALI